MTDEDRKKVDDFIHTHFNGEDAQELILLVNKDHRDLFAYTLKTSKIPTLALIGSMDQKYQDYLNDKGYSVADYWQIHVLVKTTQANTLLKIIEGSGFGTDAPSRAKAIADFFDDTDTTNTTLQ